MSVGEGLIAGAICGLALVICLNVGDVHGWPRTVAVAATLVVIWAAVPRDRR